MASLMLQIKSRTLHTLLFASLALCALQANAAPQNDLLPVEPIRVIEGGDKLGLRHPSNVVTASDNRILVLDGVSNRVVSYTYEGKFQNSFGKGGTAEDELSYPLGMTIDAKDNVYIADSGNARVQVYNRQGKHLRQIPLPHNEKQKRPDPTDVRVLSSEIG